MLTPTPIILAESTGLRSHGPDYWTILAGARTTDGTPIYYHAVPGARVKVAGKLLEVVKVIDDGEEDACERVVLRQVRE